MLLLLALSLSPGALARQYVYTQNSISGDVSVISVPEHELVAKIPGLPRSDDLIASPDGRLLLLSLQRDDIDHALEEPTSGEIVAVDTRTREIRWRLPIEDGQPHHLAMHPDGLLYVPIFDRPYAYVIDITRREIVQRLDALFGMHSIQLSDDGERLYAGSMLTQSLYVFDLNKGRLQSVIDFKDGVRPIAVARDESVLYAQRSRLHGFDVVDLARKAVVRTVNLPALPADFVYPTTWPHNVNHGLGLSPDQHYLLAAGSVENYVAVYTHPDLQLQKVIDVGSEPNWITFDPSSRYAYIGCRGDNVVSVIDLESLEEVARVPTGGLGTARLIVVEVPDS
jgi:DNA-binding beta-propeller fold protein YncE